jgi:hypothetical protein
VIGRSRLAQPSSQNAHMTYLFDIPVPPGPRSRARALPAGWALLIAIAGAAVTSVGIAALAR